MNQVSGDFAQYNDPKLMEPDSLRQNTPASLQEQARPDIFL